MKIHAQALADCDPATESVARPQSTSLHAILDDLDSLVLDNRVDTINASPLPGATIGPSEKPRLANNSSLSNVIHIDSSDDDSSTHFIVSLPSRNSNSTLGKHIRSLSDDSSTADVGISSKRPAPIKEPHDENCGPIGISRAARHDQRVKEEVLCGDYVASKSGRAALLRRLRTYNLSARFVDPENSASRLVVHSVCGREITLDGPMHTMKFRRHVKNCLSNGGRRKNCKTKKAAINMLTIDSMFKRTKNPTRPTPPGTPFRSPSPPPQDPCCGLRLAHDSRLTNITNCGTLGGRKSIHFLSQERYRSPYSMLTTMQKTAVKLAATATASWIVHHDPEPHIRSTKCDSYCDPAMSELTPSDICQPCGNLLCKREFRNALGPDPPPDKNLKYVPNDHRNKQSAVLYGRYIGLKEIIEQATSTRSPLMNFVIKTLKGDVKNGDMFIGLLHAMAAKDDKDLRGKGMQNFPCLLEFVDFCHAALISSPQTYRLLRKHFPMPSERNLRHRRSLMPGFPIGICERTFENAVDYLAKIDYTGPVCISCDNTMLLSKISPHFDAETKRWLLVGGISKPVEINDEAEDVNQQIVKVVNETEKATKCRLWCLQVPTPGVPVFPLAALPIGATVKAKDLLEMHNNLFNSLLERGICVVSYSCDGSVTERKVATLFLETARDSQTTRIPHPKPDYPPILIVVHRFGSSLTPIVTTQDLKHAAKSARNGLYSGSTGGMVIGNCPVHYLQVLALSKFPQSPIYSCDVTRVDHQDNHAAMQLFSSAFIRHVLSFLKQEPSKLSTSKCTVASSTWENFPSPDTVFSHKLTGLAVWLFVFGDFFDAYQNRSLDMAIRTTMVFRMKFFLQIWKNSLKALGYADNQHYLTCDLQFILDNLIHSFLALVIIYRSGFDHPNYLLCPWLHSTESCEHTFGEARKTKPDFTFADFILMVPKLKILADSAIKTGNYDGDAKARASGYFHTQYSTRDLNINALSSFPSNVIIQQCAATAYGEAHALFSLCGIPAAAVLAPTPVVTESSPTKPVFIAPPIHEWFPNEEEAEDGVWVASNMACELQEEHLSTTAELDRLLSDTALQGSTTADLDDQMDAYAAAGVALDLEEQALLYAMADRNSKQDWADVRQNLAHSAPLTKLQPVVLAGEIDHSALVGCSAADDFDYAPLLTIREAHETHFAKKAVRIGTFKPEVPITTVTNDSIDTATNVSPTLARSLLVKQIHSSLKAAGKLSKGIAGGTRRARHEGKFEVVPAGNAANANTVSKLQGEEVLKTRLELFKHYKLKCTGIIGTAGVTALSPIQIGSYAIVLEKDQLWIGEIVTMYSKGAGKGGNHNWVPKVTNVVLLSNTLVKLWEQWQGREFCSIVKSTASLHAYRYALVSSPRLIYVAQPNNKPNLIAPDRMHISSSLFGVWEMVSAELPQVNKVVAKLLRRKRAAQTGKGDNT